MKNVVTKLLRNYHLILLCSVYIFISGCATSITPESWPTTMPDRDIFVQSWAAQNEAGKNDNSIENHLLWVRRFYEGSLLSPIGWTSMSERVVGSLSNEQDQEFMHRRLFDLGIDICTEWAQNSDVRKINTANVAVWGGAIRTAIEQNEQFEYLSLIETDVNALIDGTLMSSQISRERYYPAEDFDDF